MKKIFILFILFLSQISLIFADIQDTLKSNMKPNSNTILGNSSEIGGGRDSLLTPLASIKNIILGVLSIIVVGVFIYLGFRLIQAEGKPDEFKKVMLGFVYAIVGLAIIPLAWVLVKLISSLQF